MGFDIDGARKAGYTDDQIADYLAGQKGIDVGAARKAGYTTDRLLVELSDAFVDRTPAATSQATASAGLASVSGARRGGTRGEARPYVAPDQANTADPLSKPAPVDQRQPLIEQRGAPVTDEVMQATVAQLSAMPRAQRQAQAKRTDLPGWMQETVRRAVEQIDAGDAGAQRVDMAGPSLESRTARAMRQGADLPTATAKATTDAMRGAGATPLQQATAGPGLLTGEEVTANKAEGEKMQRRSLAARGLYGAQEGMVQGTAGLIAMGLRAAGDEEAAKFYERAGQGAAVRSEAANELMMLREKAQDAGVIPRGALEGALNIVGLNERNAVGAVNSVGQMLPGIAAGLATGSAGAGLAMMALPVFGQSYIDKRDAGGSPGMSAAYGGAMAALEIIGERYGMLPAALNAFKKEVAKKPLEEVPAFIERGIAAMEKRGLFSKTGAAILRGQAGEQFGEQITGAGQYLLDGTAFGLDKPISLMGFIENARDTAVQTLLATGVMQAGGAAAKRAMRGTQVAEDPDATDRPASAPMAQPIPQRVEPTMDAAAQSSSPAQVENNASAPMALSTGAPAEAPTSAQNTAQPEAQPAAQAVDNITGILQQAGALPQDFTGLDETPRADALAPEPAPVEGEKINRNWSAFAPESGTLGIPREQMPQISAEHRGAFVNFLKARGITAEQGETEASSLKPTQAEFSPRKVQAARDFKGGDRAILVSSDGYVLDGTHQWAASLERNDAVRVLRLGAPIDELIRLGHAFPSSTTSSGARLHRSLPDVQAGSEIGQPDSAALQSSEDRPALGAKLLRDGVATESFRKEGLSGLDVPSRRAMLTHMFDALQDFKVLNRVVESVPVDVVHVFTGKQGSAKVLLHDKTMLEDVAATNEVTPVAGWGDAASTLMRSVATAAAERFPGDSVAKEPGEFDSASGTSELSVRQGASPSIAGEQSPTKATKIGRAKTVHSSSHNEKTKRTATKEPTDGQRTDASGTAQPGPTDGAARTGADGVVQGELQQPAAAGTARGTGDGPVASGGAAPTGPGRGSNALKPGATVTLDGKAWTVDQVKPTAVGLRDADGKTRMVARNGATFQKIMAALQPAATAPEPATAETNPALQGAQSDEVIQPSNEAGVQTAGLASPATTTESPREQAQPQVYKTKDAASKAAKEAGNTLKVQKVKDGFILRQKTVKEIDAEAKAAQRLARGKAVDTESDTLLTAIAKLGGLDMSERADTIGSGNKNIGGKMLYRNGGQSIDTLANEALHELGYIPPEEHASDGGVRWLRDAIAAEFMGTRTHHSQRGESWMERAQAEAALRYEEPDPLADFTADDLAAEGYTGPTPEQQHAIERLLIDAAASGIDTEALVEDVARATEGKNTDDYHAALKEAVDQAIAGNRGSAEGPDARAARGSNSRDGKAAGTQGQEQGRGSSKGQAEGLTLEAQTAEDLKSKTDREAAALRAEKAKKDSEQARLKKEAEARDDKARADQTVNDFQLGQSAEQQMSGMGDLFAEPGAVPATVEADNNQATKLSRSGRAGRGISITDAEAIAADIRATMPTAPQIVVVESVGQLPDKLRNLIEQAGADNDVEGVYWGGKVYAVTAHFSDLDRFRFVVAHHELRHHGFGAMLGPRLHRLMMQIYRSNAKVRELADKNIRDGIAKDVVVATEEALADMPVEDLVKLNFWASLKAAVREFLRNLAMKLEKKHPKLADMLRPEGWTDEDIARLISRAEDMSRTGEPDYVRGGAVFSQQADQTKSEAFRKWFGDSKVVDANGDPLVVYHGTRQDFDTFRPSHDGGIYASSSGKEASAFAGDWLGATAENSTYERGGARVMPVYVSMQNPHEVDADGELFDPDMTRDAIREAKAGGHDGIIIRNIQNFDGGEASDTYISFKPNQIKSAIGNNGEFNPDSADIRFSRARAKHDQATTGAMGADQAQPAPVEQPGQAPAANRWTDDLGRLRFTPGQVAFDMLGRAASPLLVKLGMKAASPELKRQLRAMRLEVQKAQDVALAVAQQANELSPEERAMVSDIIEKEMASETIPPEHAVRLAAVMNQAMATQTQELVRLGMLSQEVADRWNGKYLPRFYESKLGDKAKDAWNEAIRALRGKPKTMQGIKAKHLKGRGLYETIPADSLAEYEALGWEVRDDGYVPGETPEVQVWRDYTREERDGMGEIRDAAFRFVTGYMQTQRDIALGRMFEAMASDETLSSRTVRDGWVKVPDTSVEGTNAKRYGKLAGRYVAPEVLSHLSSVEEAQSDALQLYRKAMAWWKQGKTALNPVSHANNIISNLTMAHFAGVSYWDAHKYVGALQDFITKAPGIQEARDAGLFLSTMSDAELAEALPPDLRALAMKADSATRRNAKLVLEGLTSWFLTRPMGAAYNAEDLFFRYLIWRDARAQGMALDAAVEYAQKYIFTYDDMPKGVRMVRDFAIPFVGYTYKALPALLHTAMVYPWRMAAPAAVLWAANAAAYAIFAGGDDDDSWWSAIQKYLNDPEHRKRVNEAEKLERENLPQWMKGSTALLTPKAIRLGVDEVTSLPLFVDVSRVVPGGDLFDVTPNAGGLPIPQPLTPSHPLFTIATAMIANRDLWTGKDLVDSNDTKGEATAKRSDWMWKQVSPAIAVGNYHWERLMQALAHANGGPVKWLPDTVSENYTGIGRDGLPVQPKYAIPQTFGIKVRPVDLEKSQAMNESRQQKLIRDIDSEVRQLDRLAGRGSISDSLYEKLVDKALEKRANLSEGLTVDGDKPE